MILCQGVEKRLLWHPHEIAVRMGARAGAATSRTAGKERLLAEFAGLGREIALVPGRTARKSA